MISGLLIFAHRGDILASRAYKDGLKRAVTDTFRAEVIANPDRASPLFTIGSTSFLYIRHNELFVVAIVRHNVDASLVYEFLYRFVELYTSQFGKLDETSCYRHVSQIYEIMGEMVDFGYPQVTEVEVLRQSLSQNSNNYAQNAATNLLRRASTVAGRRSSNTQPNYSQPNHNQATSSIQWRRPDIRHRRNEVYVDILEQLSFVLDPEGEILSCHVDGAIRAKVQLSGMPRCQLTLNDVEASPLSREDGNPIAYQVPGNDQQNLVKLEDCRLHQCVDHSKFTSMRTIVFIPPEGESELVRYRVTQGIKLPFRLVSRRDSIRIQCLLDRRLFAANVVISVAAGASKNEKIKVTTGRAKLVASNRIEWRLGRLTGGSEATMSTPAQFEPGSSAEIKFEISSTTCSGLLVRHLRISEKYSTLKWVRYEVNAGSCETRIPD